MGTNYYWREKACPTCNRSNNEIHIGKSSAGWTFSFHETFECKSWSDWQHFLENEVGAIFDEYGDRVSVDEFKRIVGSKKFEHRNHAKLSMDNSYLDPEGHSFTRGEFS